jgi:hypothetical protein
MREYSGRKTLAIGDPRLKTRVERTNPQYHLINRIDDKSRKALDEINRLVLRYAQRGKEEENKSLTR